MIDNAKKGAAKDSAYGYKDAVNKYYITKLSENQNAKLNGTYTVEEDGTIQGMDLDTKSYTDKLDISVSGTVPTGGYLNYENSILTSGCLTMDEYKVTIENGEVTTAEIGSCDSISLTACDSVNFNPSPESWFTFDSTTGTITGFSDAWDGTTDITIPCQIDGVDVVNIGNDTNYSGVFASKNLTSVILNDNILTIGTGAFNGNELTSINITNNVTKIGLASFYSNKLEKITLGNNVTNIEQSAFDQNNISELTIPNSVKRIEMTAFMSNEITSLTIPNGVEYIGPSAFLGNPLTTLTVESGEIDERAFASTKLKNVTIGSNVTIIGGAAFQANEIEKLVLEEGIEKIYAGAFGDNNIKNLSIPSSVNFIGGGAFFANDLYTITINSKDIQIESGAFFKSSGNNVNLTTIYNNSDKSLDWGMIINNSSTATEYNFETGTVVNEIGNIEVVKSN